MSCELVGGGGIRSKFASGNGLVDLSFVDGDVVVRLRLGGTEWTSTGDAPEPQVSDANGDAGASWSSEVSNGERIETAELVLAC